MCSQRIKFNKQTLDGVPYPLSGQQEYRLDGFEHLALIAYPRKKSFVFRASSAGKRICRTLGTYPQTPLSAIKSAVLKMESDLQGHQLFIPENIRVAEAMEQFYMPDLLANKRNTQPELSKVNRHILPYWGDCIMNRIKKCDIEVFKTIMVKKYQPATVNRMLSILSRLFTLCCQEGALNQSPLRYVKKLPENNIRHRVLTKDEITHFVTAARKDNTPQAKALLLALYTGLRISEVLSIERENYDRDSQTIFIPKTKSNRSHTVCLSLPAQSVVQEQLHLAAESHYLFCRPNDKEKHIGYPRDAFRRICKMSDIHNAGIHQLRHTYGQIALELSSSVSLVSKLLNHSNQSVTLRYAQFTSNQQKDISTKIGEYISQP